MNQEIQDICLSKRIRKVCFQHDMDYRGFTELNRRAAADKVLHDKAFSLAKNPKYDGYHRGLVSMVDK